MKIAKWLIVFAASALIVVVAVLKITGRNQSGASRRVTATLVKVEQPKTQTVDYNIQLTGDILPVQQANIYSKVSGNLDHIYADMGDFVHEDQLLALIDTTELAQQFQQAAATYQNAAVEYERVKKLVDQNFAAKQDLDNADASLKVAKAIYDGSKTRLDYARITAPFAGYITRRYLDPGALVNSSNSILFTLMDLDKMKIIANILERDIPLVTKSTRAVITVDAFPGKQFEGTITRLSEAVDLATRTMAVEIDIPNAAHALKPGMYASMTLVLNEHRDALTLPTQAILKDDAGYYVYISDGKMAHRKDVKIGEEQDNRTEIVAGLDSIDKVVTTGQQFLRDGEQIAVQQ